jgi:hypothetical protein
MYVSRMGHTRNAYRFLVGKYKVRNHLGDLDVDGNLIPKWVLKIGRQFVN